jgi:hypothetical protein
MKRASKKTNRSLSIVPMKSPLEILTHRHWQLTAATLFFAVLLVVFGRGTPKEGQKNVTYKITVVPSDAQALNCALSAPVNGDYCAFDDNQRRQPVTEPLRPYISTKRELLLLKGVFETKAVAEWSASAISRHSDSRVTLECQATNLGVVPNVLVRWSDADAFRPENNVMAAVVRDCIINR